MSSEISDNPNILEKNYNASSVEPRIIKKWDDANAFAAGAGAREGEDSFTIVIPPPNVTGSLHMGHALNNTLQDILIRFERMRGKDVLWQPGMDHAGIATQMVVERQLAANNEPDRHAMGREKFIERVWEWKEQSGGIIFNQLKRLGASCDWSRERFTMDEGLSQAVLKVFVTLYKEGLIYKDKRLVNWDPVFQTAISDIEVEQIELKGNLWHLRYPLENGRSYQHPYNVNEEGEKTGWKPSDGEPAGYETRDYLVVATTRPETMLGDSGVAVHPDDPRYKDLIGANVILPIVGRSIPIVADEYPDPEAGTGAVKMTPAHDFNDFEVGNRHGLKRINILTPDAKIFIKENNDFLEGLESTPQLVDSISQLDGVERFKARAMIIEMFSDAGLLELIEPHTHMVPHGDRGGVPIEPYLTDQWYVSAKELSRPAIASVKEGRTNFVPKNWENTYFNWMENIQPWCISRQLWWGHQIPAWYGPDGEIFVEKDEAAAMSAAEKHYGKPTELVRDEDVLDTWFSSALWPFSTLGWPQNTPELANYYPTNTLSTAFDIIFFWVARMMMFGLHFMKDDEGKSVEPFDTVYIHPLVLDKKGAKMSKSKGNGIDPLVTIDEYGADALRFTLAIMAVQGRDIKLDPARIAGYRNFGTKLWNATRFSEMNGVKYDPDFNPETVKFTVNRWILAEASKATEQITSNLEKLRFNDAASSAYRFVWNIYCDWYLELLKPVFSGKDQQAKSEAQSCAAYVLAEIYKMLHPFMPFMTEELWQRTINADRLLCHEPWSTSGKVDTKAANEINWLIDLVSEIRSVRAEMGIKPGLIMKLKIVGNDPKTLQWINDNNDALARLARVEEIELLEVAPSDCAQIIIDGLNYCLPLEGVVDIDQEKSRLKGEASRLTGEVKRLDGKLSNERFVANAPADVVAIEREKLDEYRAQLERTNQALSRFS